MSDRVDEYIASLFARDDDVLAALREAADREGLPPISIGAVTGRLLQILLHAVRANHAEAQIGDQFVIEAAGKLVGVWPLVVRID